MIPLVPHHHQLRAPAAIIMVRHVRSIIFEHWPISACEKDLDLHSAVGTAALDTMWIISCF